VSGWGEDLLLIDVMVVVLVAVVVGYEHKDDGNMTMVI